MKRQFILMLVMAISLLAAVQTLAQNLCTSFACEDVDYGLSEAKILENPQPDVDNLLVNEALIHDRLYWQLNGTVDVHDAPNGAVIRTIDEGFNFVTSLGEQDGWININPGEWILASSLTPTNGIISTFTGVLLSEDELPYPIAWSLINQYPSKIPGGNPVESNGMTWRYTLMYIYDTVEVDGYNWYQIGVDDWVHQHHVAMYIPAERPDEVQTDLWISIDLYEQVLIVYKDDQPIFTTLIATGLDRWPTHEGVYHIYFRKLRKHMSGGQVGDDYYFLEEVPWTMFFDEGRALHGAYWHDGFGYRRSHGCVNLSITDAHWIYQLVADYMGKHASADIEEGPAVYIYSSGKYE